MGFIIFGLALIVVAKFLLRNTDRAITVPATIIGYKQFPSDQLIVTNDISHGPNLLWLRVVEFTNPQTGQKLQMLSNPGVLDPEPIGTILTVLFDPAKMDPVRDFVWVRGGLHAYYIVGTISAVVGAVLVILNLLSPSSALVLIGMFVSFGIVFMAVYRAVYHRHQ